MGVAARVVPGTYEEAAAALRDGVRDGGCAIVGSGARNGWFPPARDARTEIASSALAGIVRHTPADLTVCVRGGTPLEELQRALREQGQWLPLDPTPAGTVGGLVAANDNGPVRMRYGGVRDALIGVRVALPNGAVARFGGDVVKNVAGYDLTKAYVGGAGAFGMLVEASFKVQPLPPTERAWRMEGDASALREAAGRLRRKGLPYAALELTGARGSADWHLDALAHGEVEVVERLGRELTADGSSRTLRCSVLDPGAVVEQAARPAHAGVWMRVGVPPAALFAVLDALPTGIEVIARPAIGIADIYGADAEGAALERLAALVAGEGGHAHLRTGAPHLREAFGWWRAERGGSRLFAMLKDALDPGGRCNAGRTVYEEGRR